MAIGLSGTAHAGVVINNPAGTLLMGINDNGSLDYGTGVTSNGGAAIAPDGSGGGFGSAGIAFKFPDGTFRDATSPGCLCEGWGVSVNGTTSGYANVSTDNGGQNLSYAPLVSTASTATTSTSLTSLPGLLVTQAYQPATTASSALFRDHVTISNNTGAAVTDLKYVRVMDWDVPPTEFQEYVTIKGTASTTLLELSGDNGFNSANPLAAYTNRDPACLNADCIDSGVDDHGAYFRFNFGSLADAASYEFDIFYGAAATEREAIAAIAAEGLELYSLGQSSGVDSLGTPNWITGTPATYIFGFKGVGGIIIEPIPEPTTLALLGIGMAGFAAKRRRKV
jgi:type IV pilus assembly protein PilY1